MFLSRPSCHHHHHHRIFGSFSVPALSVLLFVLLRFFLIPFVFSPFFVSFSFFPFLFILFFVSFLSRFLVFYESSVFVPLFLVSAQTFIYFLQCSTVLLPTVSFLFLHSFFLSPGNFWHMLLFIRFLYPGIFHTQCNTFILFWYMYRT